MANGIVETNGVTLWYDRIGKPENPAFLLITGAHGQAVAWDVCFCEMLAERGFQVIRFDQRDTGLSGRIPEDKPFNAADLGDDAIGLLDALGVAEAHLAGISAGGVYAQYAAIRHPQQVLSLISMMSTSGDVRNDPLIEAPSDRVREFGERPAPTDYEGKIERMLESFRDYVSGPRYPVNEEYIRAYAAAMLERGDRAGDSPRLIEAVYKSLPVPAEQITAPTLVIHGTADPVIRYTAGLSTVRAIRGTRLLTVEGMGHDLTSPRAFPWLVEAFAHHAQTAPPMWVRKGLKAPSAASMPRSLLR